MDKNRIEDWFSKNRAAFNDEDAPLGHFGRFDEKLEKRFHEEEAPAEETLNIVSEKKWSVPIWMRTAVAAACVLFAAFVVMNPTANEKATKQSNNEGFNFQEFYDAEKASFEAFNEKKGIIRVMATTDNSDFISDAMTQYQRLEREYDQLKRELEATNGNSRVAAALSQNVRRRASFLEQVISRIDQTGNNYYNESTVQNAAHTSFDRPANCCGFFEADKQQDVSALHREVLLSKLRRK